MSAVHKIQIGFDEQTDRLSKTINDIDIDLGQLYVGKTLHVSNIDSRNVSDIKFLRSTGSASDTWFSSVSTGSLEYTLNSDDLNRYIRVKCTDKYDNIVEKTFYFSSLPVVYIDTKNKQTIGKLDVDARVRIQGNLEFGQQYDGKAEIHVRGDSSTEYTTQLPYKIKLKKKTNLFGFGANRHWVLISNFVDTSLMRNMLATRMAADIGVSYAKMRHVVVILNGVNVGVYMLAEHIRVNENRVNIFNWEDEAENRGYKNDNLTWVDQDESIDVSGGYLYELDQGYDETTQFTTNGGIKVMLRRPEYARGSFRMANSEMEFWRRLEKTFTSLDYSYGESNLTDMIDVNSLARLLLVNMVFGNIDVSTRSLFASKDIGGKVVFGPVWDFDLGANSVVYSSQYPYNVWGVFRNTSQCFYKELLSFPYICERLYNTYQSSGRQSLVSILADFDSIASGLSAVGSMNDSARRTNTFSPSWLGSSITLRSNEDDVRALKTYLQNRLTWLDQQFSSVKTTMTSIAGEISQVNPYNRYYSVRFIIDGNENRYNTADIVNYSKRRSFIQADIRYASQEPYDVDIILNGKIVQTLTDINERILFQHPIDDYLDCDYVTLEVLIHNKAPEEFKVRSYIVLRMT